MRFDDKALKNRVKLVKFDKEGRLSYKTQKESYRQRWFRLHGNLLFYYRLTDKGMLAESDPIGVLVLERYSVQLEQFGETPFAFSVVFDGDGADRKHWFSGSTLDVCQDWVKAIKKASLEQLQSHIYDLQQRILQLTGQDPLVELKKNPHRYLSRPATYHLGQGQSAPTKAYRPLSEPLPHKHKETKTQWHAPTTDDNIQEKKPQRPAPPIPPIANASQNNTQKPDSKPAWDRFSSTDDSSDLFADSSIAPVHAATQLLVETAQDPFNDEQVASKMEGPFIDQNNDLFSNKNDPFSDKQPDKAQDPFGSSNDPFGDNKAKDPFNDSPLIDSFGGKSSDPFNDKKSSAFDAKVDKVFSQEKSNDPFGESESREFSAIQQGPFGVISSKPNTKTDPFQSKQPELFGATPLAAIPAQPQARQPVPVKNSDPFGSIADDLMTPFASSQSNRLSNQNASSTSSFSEFASNFGSTQKSVSNKAPSSFPGQLSAQYRPMTAPVGLVRGPVAQYPAQMYNQIGQYRGAVVGQMSAPMGPTGWQPLITQPRPAAANPGTYASSNPLQPNYSALSGIQSQPTPQKHQQPKKGDPFSDIKW